MEKMIKKIRNSKGFVSIETVIVAGLVLGLGIFTVSAFNTQGNALTSKALNTISTQGTAYTVTPPTQPVSK